MTPAAGRPGGDMADSQELVEDTADEDYALRRDVVETDRKSVV